MAYHNHHSHVDCIRLVPIFNHLNDEQMHLIAQSANEVQYVKNELLFRFGDKAVSYTHLTLPTICSV